LERARRRLSAFGRRVTFERADFGDLDSVLQGLPAPDGILADLGVSSMQLDEPERGFSFRRDGPLDMRMGRDGRSAADIIATASAEELTRIFRDFGEERMAAKIARGIVAERTRSPIATTRHLARIVAGQKGSREKIDPATRVFQALRIEVNQELVALARFLAAAVARLNEGGRLAVISYHSLEDRIVKETFRRESGVCMCPPRLPVCVCGARTALRVLTRRPIRPSEAEQRRNPRSRSARLRVAVKISSTDASPEAAALIG
jgi:16S rRNA (cytosine1402-N4)-methyltransferase